MRIPFVTTQATVQSLLDAIRHAGDSTGMSEERAAMVVTHFLDALTDRISAGEVVTIPGFGRFGAYLYEREGRRPIVQPRFVPARPLRNQVDACCPPAKANNHKLEAYRRSHHPSSRPEKSGSRTFSVMRTIRQHIEKNAAGMLPD